MKALTIAATGMNAQQLNLEVIANNIANINTTGFKRARAEFSDLLYQSERTAGVPNQANQSIVPEGALVGLGVQTAAVRNLHIQGSFNQTGNPYDVAGSRSRARPARRFTRAPVRSTRTPTASS